MKLSCRLFFYLGAVTLAPISFTWAQTNERLAIIPKQESSAPAEQHAIPADRLAESLRRGGYVIYFRHTATDFSKSDANMKHYDDCANQRLLSDAGRESARNIGKHVRDMGLPLGEVLASPYCRTMETARLAFLRAEPRAEIREIGTGDYAGLKQLLSAPVEAGTNRWIVGHGIPFRAIAGPPHLSEGEAAVIRPEGSSWRVMARIRDHEWGSLLQHEGRVNRYQVRKEAAQ